MSKGDLITLRQHLETLIDNVWVDVSNLSSDNSALQERIVKLEKDFERLRMSVTALNNLVKGNVR